MDRRCIWIVAAAIVLGFTILGISQAVAQRGFRTGGQPVHDGFARYVVVNVADGEVIIMDVTSGDLYSASPKDVKPYRARPRPDFIEKKNGFEKKEFKDKGEDFKKDGDEKKGFDKDGDEKKGFRDEKKDFKDKGENFKKGDEKKGFRDEKKEKD